MAMKKIDNQKIELSQLVYEDAEGNPVKVSVANPLPGSGGGGGGAAAIQIIKDGESQYVGQQNPIPVTLNGLLTSDALNVVDGNMAQNFGYFDDAVVTDPAADATLISLTKGILSNTGLVHFDNQANFPDTTPTPQVVNYDNGFPVEIVSPVPLPIVVTNSPLQVIEKTAGGTFAGLEFTLTAGVPEFIVFGADPNFVYARKITVWTTHELHMAHTQPDLDVPGNGWGGRLIIPPSDGYTFKRDVGGFWIRSAVGGPVMMHLDVYDPLAP